MCEFTKQKRRWQIAHVPSQKTQSMFALSSITWSPNSSSWGLSAANGVSHCLCISTIPEKDRSQDALYRIIEWFELKGIFKDDLVPTPLPRAGTPFTRWSCSKPHSAWPWTLSMMRHPHLGEPMLVPHHPHHNCHSSRGPQRFDLLLVVHHTQLFFSLQFKEFWLTAQPTETAEQEYACSAQKDQAHLASSHCSLHCTQDLAPLPTYTARLCLVFVLGGTKTSLLAAPCKGQSVRIAFTSVKAKGLISFNKARIQKEHKRNKKGTVPKIQCSSNWKISADSVHDQRGLHMLGFISHLLPREI